MGARLAALRWGVALLGLAGTGLCAAQAAVHRSVQGVTGQQVVLRADAASTAPVSSARAVYQLHCMGCHRPQAQGEPMGRVPDLRQMGAFLHLPGGREFLLRVPGLMGAGLNDGQVAEVVNWLLQSAAQAWVPQTHRPYSTAEVQWARQNSLRDVAGERARLVALAQAQGLPLHPIYRLEHVVGVR